MLVVTGRRRPTKPSNPAPSTASDIGSGTLVSGEYVMASVKRPVFT